MRSRQRKAVKQYHIGRVPDGAVVTINITGGLLQALHQVSRAHHISRSEYMRRVLLSDTEIRNQLALMQDMADLPKAEGE